MNPIFASPAVCNTGPLIALARVDMAWLPFRLFPEVVIPEEVCDELFVKESPDQIPLAEALEGRTYLSAPTRTGSPASRGT